jgi:fucose permease
MQEKGPSLPLIAITFGNMSLLGFFHSMKGVSFPLIRNSYGASYNDMGIMNAMIMFSAVFFSIIAGFFMNRFGLKRAIVSAFFLVVLGACALLFASSFWMAVGLYLIIQSGYGFLEIGLNGTGVRIFTRKSGLMLNLLHFFFGVGAICGPRFMGFMVTRIGLSWQEVYPIALIPLFVMLAITLFIRYPGREEAAVTGERPSFLAALKDPQVWFFGVILGIASSVEGCSVAWSGLYLQDVYGLDPGVEGAAFVSAFFMLYTFSRFSSGFVIEKTGYIRSIFVSSLIIIVLFIVAFSLGRTGINLLPVTGFFIAIMWPTILAITVGVFKEKAQTASSAILCIAFTLGGIIQYGFGITNVVLGAAWGYRSCVVYSIILAVLLFLLGRKNKARGWNIR